MLKKENQCSSRYKLKVIHQENATSFQNIKSSLAFKEIVRKILVEYEPNKQ